MNKMRNKEENTIKVLFVEDNPGDTRLISEMLKEVNASLFWLMHAKSLKEAFNQLEAEHFDIILSDLGLSDSCGLDTFVRLHDRVPKLPIIVMTGLDDEVTGIKAVREGAQDYLVKGQVDGNLLMRSLRYAIERKRTEEEIKQLNECLEKKVKKRTAEIEKLLKNKDEFISQLGHDIKTPLTPLLSLLPIIEKKETDPELKELLNVCIRNSGYIKHLVVSTLKLARLNSNDAVFDIKEISLLDIVDSIFSEYRAVFDKRDIAIENGINEKTIVLADYMRLKEVIDHLITNAIKFMEDGGRLTIFAEENDCRFTTISVRDTGIGLDEKAKSHLFEELYKADQSRHELDSSGLGLVICKRIIEKHGGKIWVKSPGERKGTTFYFTIPKKSEVEHLAALAG